MNFVFVGSSPRAWGSEQHFIGLAQSCAEAGHRVIAVVRAGSKVAGLLADAGIDVRAIPFRGGSDPRAMIAAYKAIREIDADWIVTGHKKHYWPLYLLARATGTKLAVFRHLVDIRDWATRVVFPRLVDRFFVVSDFALERLVQAGAPRQRLTRLHNQVDLRQFRPNPQQRWQTRIDLGLPLDAVVIGFVGRHEEGKGVYLLREALRQAMIVEQNLYAIWVGDGPHWSQTQKSVAASGDTHRHRFVEWTASPERFYVAFDCLVAPSLAPETFGRVTVEAQACGVPVIASTAGGLRETFAAGGEVFAGHDPTILAEQILNLCNDPIRRAAMSRAGLMFVKKFDAPFILQSFLESLLARGSQALAIEARAIEPLSPAKPEANANNTVEIEPQFDSDYATRSQQIRRPTVAART